MFVASNNFVNFEEALKFLLNQSEEKATREVAIEISKRHVTNGKITEISEK